MSDQPCEICGYKSAIQYEDGVYRCGKCVDILVYGRPISHFEVQEMGLEQLDNLNQQWSDYWAKVKNE